MWSIVLQLPACTSALSRGARGALAVRGTLGFVVGSWGRALRWGGCCRPAQERPGGPRDGGGAVERHAGIHSCHRWVSPSRVVRWAWGRGWGEARRRRFPRSRPGHSAPRVGTAQGGWREAIFSRSSFPWLNSTCHREPVTTITDTSHNHGSA